MSVGSVGRDWGNAAHQGIGRDRFAGRAAGVAGRDARSPFLDRTDTWQPAGAGSSRSAQDSSSYSTYQRVGTGRLWGQGATPATGSPPDAVATLLGSNPTDLATQLQQGASLNDLATSQGVAHTDLINAIQSGLPQWLRNSTDTTALAEQIAAAPGTTPATTSPTDAVATLLGSNPTDLATQLQQGASLNDLATSQGVAHTDLINAIQSGLPQWLQNSTDTTALAEQIAAAPGTTPATTSPTDATQQGDPVVAALGGDAGALVAQLRKGASLSDVATSQGVSHADLISAIQAGLPQQVQDSGDTTALAEQIAATPGLQTPDGGGDRTVSRQAGRYRTSGHNGFDGGFRFTRAFGRSGANRDAGRVWGRGATPATGSPTDAVATLLGSNPTDLATQLQQGASLNDLATSQGVAHTDLINAIQSGLPQWLQNSTDTTALAEQIAAAPGTTPATTSPPDAVATLLGSNPTDLATQLQQGASLNDLATSQGVAHTDLINAIQSGLPQWLQNSTDTTALAEQIAAAPGTTPATTSPTDAVATLLGSNPTDLATQLQQGASLNDLATSQGVAHTDLINAIQSGLPQWLQNSTDTTALAEQIAAAPGTTPATTSPTDAVATLLGSNPTDLATQLQQGASLNDLATSQGVAHTDLINAIQSGLPQWLQNSTDTTALAEQIAAAPGTTPATTSPTDAVATLLGSNPTDLATQLQQGASLNDLATSQGVAHTDLINAIQSGLPQWLQNSTDTTALAEQIAAAPGTTPATDAWQSGSSGSSGVERHRRFDGYDGRSRSFGVSERIGDARNAGRPWSPGTAPATGSSTDAVATLLGSNPTDLATQLQQGASLNDLATSHGVAHTDLINAIQSALPQWLQNSVDTTALTEQIADTPGTTPVS